MFPLLKAVQKARPIVPDALGGARGGRLLGEPICRRPILPSPAALRFTPLRLDPPPVVCPSFGFHRLMINLTNCSSSVLQGFGFRVYVALKENIAPHPIPI